MLEAIICRSSGVSSSPCLVTAWTTAASSSSSSFPAIVSETDYDLSKSVYVLHANFNGPFIEREKLKIVYRGEATEVVVAVREEAVSGPGRNCTVRPF